MPSNQSITQSLLLVSEKLRVPEIKYTAVEQLECRELTRDFLQLINDKPGAASMALSDVRQTFFPDSKFSVRAMNLMFVVDRCFDVWLRKSGLDNCVQIPLLASRGQVFSLAYSEPRDTRSLESMAALLDLMGNDLQGWCENPERAKKQVPQLIYDTFAGLCGSLTFDAVVEASASWERYWSDAGKRRMKITERLLVAESDLISKQFCNAFAHAYLNKQFASRSVSSDVQEFLQTHWRNLISTVLSERVDAELPDAVTLLGKKLRAVFCDKGKAAFRYGETLVDETVELFEHYQVPVEPAVWQTLSEQVIAILKGQPSQEQDFVPVAVDLNLDCFEAIAPKGYNEGDWLLDESTNIRAMVLKVFDRFGQVLLINHLGMKLERIDVAALNLRIKERALKKVASPVTFTSVLGTTLSGLEKVAKAQLVAREKAAQKALDEAKKLQLEQDAAAAQVRQKAEEIARRTKAIVDRKEEAQRLEKERIALELASRLTLGAWVSIDSAEGKQRFKLAVKFAARKRYVFVDKYGIKKLEYHEPELVADIVSDRLVILSDGADFDDSLERVIGRIRMSG